jgi:hypothetical protein
LQFLSNWGAFGIGWGFPERREGQTRHGFALRGSEEIIGGRWLKTDFWYHFGFGFAEAFDHEFVGFGLFVIVFVEVDLPGHDVGGGDVGLGDKLLRGEGLDREKGYFVEVEVGHFIDNSWGQCEIKSIILIAEIVEGSLSDNAALDHFGDREFRIGVSLPQNALDTVAKLPIVKALVFHWNLTDFWELGG